MPSDLKIAQSIVLQPIVDIAHRIGLKRGELVSYGLHKAKIRLEALEKRRDNGGKLILVTAITPTPYGEGKTTVSIGLSMGFWRLGRSSIVALREPSLGPVFGIKGGATGGGYAQVLPMEDINLHFTGDFHAITSAHDLLSALLDASIFHGNELGIDTARIFWPRTIDMNDRSLRHIVIGLNARRDGPLREDRFVITPDSEVMAIVGLSHNYRELKERLSRILLGVTRQKKAVHAGDLRAEGAMAVLLRDALLPNLVQTTEHTPAIVHTGPFGNIAHGTCSLTAIEAARRLSEFAVVEAGFGSDLGAEKFLNIVSRHLGYPPDVAVLVATVRALKYQGGASREEINEENITYLEQGFINLQAHLHILRDVFGVPVVVAINRFPQDTEAELRHLARLLDEESVPYALTEVYARGGEGAIDLAHTLMETLGQAENHYRPLYDLSMHLEEKIERIAREVYGAGEVDYTREARKALRLADDLNLHHLYVCMAKTQNSLSDDPKLKGWPRGFKLTVEDIRFRVGAGFAVPICGNILEMPGLPKDPAARRITLTDDGRIEGLF